VGAHHPGRIPLRQKARSVARTGSEYKVVVASGMMRASSGANFADSTAASRARQINYSSAGKTQRGAKSHPEPFAIRCRKRRRLPGQAAASEGHQAGGPATLIGPVGRLRT